MNSPDVEGDGRVNHVFVFLERFKEFKKKSSIQEVTLKLKAEHLAGKVTSLATNF